MPVLFALVAVIIAVGGWQLAVWLGEIRDKRRKYQQARAQALARGKPLLVVGGPWGTRRARRWLNKAAHGGGDVCLDIDRRAIDGHPCGVIGSVTHLPFVSKSFGAAFTSHTLEHLASIADCKQALDELNRVAEAVFIAYPSRQSIAGWLIPGHHLWVWRKGGRYYLRQRGRVGVEEEYCC